MRDSAYQGRQPLAALAGSPHAGGWICRPRAERSTAAGKLPIGLGLKTATDSLST